MTNRLITITLIFAGLCSDGGPIGLCDEAAQRDERVASFRRDATNLQFNKDGTVGLIRLSKPTVDDDVVAKLVQFPHLRYLAIAAPAVSDAGISHVAALCDLDTLFVSEASVTGRGLATLAALTKLERVSLTKLPVRSLPANTFNKLSNVVSLSLAETQVSDSSAAEIAKLSKLQSLILDKTKFTDEGVATLATLSELRLLSLVDCPVTGTCFEQFTSHPALRHLVLSGTQLNKEGLSHLANLLSLETLEIYKTQISADDVQQLVAALPKTKVFVDHTKKSAASSPATKVAAMETIEGVEADLKPVEAAIDGRIGPQTTPDFQRHVIPLLGRLGCNNRSCHGSFQGRGGFRLSMFGYDFDMDHDNLSARIDLKNPAKSLVLNKPTSDDDHEGGKRFEVGSWQQQLLRRWIESGAPNVDQDAPTFVRLEVEPSAITFSDSGETQQLRTIAIWSDGTREDVTCLTRFETKDDAVVDVDDDGLVTAQSPGDSHVVAYYDNGIQPVQVILPTGDPSSVDPGEFPESSPIDGFVVAKLQKLGLKPSELSTDEEFLRRVSLDMIGTLPTPDEVTAFVADVSPDKRERKIDELLEHPAYVAWWTNRLCDLTGSNAGYLGGTEMARPVSLQWQAWIERRVRDNVGWDQIVSDLLTSTSRKPGQTYLDFAAEQSTFTRRVDPADYAAAGNPMPHYWYRDNIRIPSDKALSVGYIFMGLRLDCAQCHKHPFDRWSQKDFELFTEFFTRIKTGLAPDAVGAHEELRRSLAVPVKLDTAALRRQSYMRIAAEGRAIPWREVWVEPPGAKPQPAKLLGDQKIDLSKVDDPRVVLAKWLRTEPNRYVARAFVNRVWANYFGRGIVNPTDDLNLANPPTHPDLIDYLANQFVDHDYDMKWLHKAIAVSRTYQLSWKPTTSNIADLKNYSHATLRRLPAEVIIDAVHQATAGSRQIGRISRDVSKRKISQHPRSYQTRSIDYSLLVFGKSLRTTNCDCEQNLSPTLPQALYLRNDRELLDLIDRGDGWIAEVSAGKSKTADLAELIEEAYLRTLSRKPTTDEVATAEQHFAKADTLVDGLRDLLWVLLNTQEFITNH